MQVSLRADILSVCSLLNPQALEQCLKCLLNMFTMFNKNWREGGKGGWMDAWMDGQTDGQTDGRKKDRDGGELGNEGKGIKNISLIQTSVPSS